ncbi:MAG TPA: nucleotidyltransferase domain-containing protein [Saprospiraceae bacterium]|nr:nucleotidyltransferase domain-containing protein [Saprospiraceae bacterium]
MSKQEINSVIINYLLRFNPERISIFGSYARGEQSDSSDLDLLVSFRDVFGLLQLVRIERELLELIGRKVDLVTERAIKNDKLKKYIQQDLQVIYP